VFVDFPHSIDRLKCEVDDHVDAIKATIQDRFRSSGQLYAATASRLTPRQLSAAVAKNSTHLALLSQRQTAAAQNVAAIKKDALGQLMSKLDALSPLSVLSRGFSITERPDGSIIRDAGEVTAGDKLTVRLAKGRLNAEVLSTEEK
jgi:exodeoxyribonuclease VII large subunit